MTDAADRLGTAWLPGAQFSERHSAIVPGPAEAVLDTLGALDTGDDRLVELMLTLREAPSRLVARLGGKSDLAERPRFGLHEFSLLERRADALVLGLAGRFWRLDFGLHPIPDADAFRHIDVPGIARLVMIYTLAPRADGQFDLVTETRVFCPDRTSRLCFTPYWYAIRLGSGFIRRRMLKMVRSKMQRQALDNSTA